jgi:hypothetical protein
MLGQDKFGRMLHISSKFPREKLVTIMKPYLYLYFTTMYSLDKSKRTYAKRELDRKLKRFVMFNPNFGKRKNLTSFRFSIINDPNDHHVNYYEDDDFMNSHKSIFSKNSVTNYSSNLVDLNYIQSYNNNNTLYSNSSDDEYDSSEDSETNSFSYTT